MPGGTAVLEIPTGYALGMTDLVVCTDYRSAALSRTAFFITMTWFFDTQKRTTPCGVVLQTVKEPSGAAAPNRFPRGEAVERSETEEEFGR